MYTCVVCVDIGVRESMGLSVLGRMLFYNMIFIGVRVWVGEYPHERNRVTECVRVRASAYLNLSFLPILTFSVSCSTPRRLLRLSGSLCRWPVGVPAPMSRLLPYAMWRVPVVGLRMRAESEPFRPLDAPCVRSWPTSAWRSTLRASSPWV